MELILLKKEFSLDLIKIGEVQKSFAYLNFLICSIAWGALV